MLPEGGGGVLVQILVEMLGAGAKMGLEKILQKFSCKKWGKNRNTTKME